MTLFYFILLIFENEIVQYNLLWNDKGSYQILRIYVV
jgi:hypothetical protein